MNKEKDKTKTNRIRIKLIIQTSILIDLKYKGLKIRFNKRREIIKKKNKLYRKKDNDIQVICIDLNIKYQN